MLDISLEVNVALDPPDLAALTAEDLKTYRLIRLAGLFRWSIVLGEWATCEMIRDEVHRRRQEGTLGIREVETVVSRDMVAYACAGVSSIAKDFAYNATWFMFMLPQ